MANTVVARVDESKLPVISGTDAYVAIFFLAWLALILVLGARGAFVTPRWGPAAGITDRFGGAARTFSGRLPCHPAAARIYSVG